MLERTSMTQLAATDGSSLLLDTLALYARQSFAIDSGDADGWAATFTTDGEFVSPSYVAPVAGREALRQFAVAYADAGRDSDTVSRHVMTNVDVVESSGDTAVVRAYLQIVATPRGQASTLVRMTTVTDELRRTSGDVVRDLVGALDVAGGWRIARRTVRRDDAGPDAILARA
jgi:uncharacterized protein (TIGR02246 family)